MRISFLGDKMYAMRNVDPELEELRKEVDGPPNLDTVALNIQRTAKRVHASYLFEHVGKATLQKLCLLISATATGKLYSGWQEFAAHMGLSMEQIRCIDYDFKGLQDPTYYVLLAYVQNVDATMDRILDALQKMQRYDIINEIKDKMAELVSTACQGATVSDCLIVKPDSIPRVPLVLCPMESVVQSTTKVIESDCNAFLQDNRQKNKQSYGCVVMLTFADDGAQTAYQIAKIFRSKQPRIGVLILQEQENYVYSRAEEFIDDCFKQVNFIIPILTREYIERISNPMKSSIEVQNKLDTKYIKYIYSLLRYEYVRNQCINNRVRCIVPDNELCTVIGAKLHPTFQAWFRARDIDGFIDNILLRRSSA